MILSIQHYLDAASRALAEVVSPAVDPANTFAVEQLALVQGVLAIVGQQWRHAYALEALELKELGLMTAQLLTMTNASPEASAKAQKAIAAIAEHRVGQQLAFGDLRVLNGELRELADGFVADVQNSGDAAVIGAMSRMLADYSKREADRSRAWFAATRIDVHWANLPPIADILDAQARA